MIPVNTSAEHDALEVWWYEEGRNCHCDLEEPDVCVLGDVEAPCDLDDGDESECNLPPEEGVCTAGECGEGITGTCSADSDCDRAEVVGKCSPGVCKEAGSNDGERCSTTADCACVGNFAPGIFWPHKVGEYIAVWPPGGDCTCVGNVCTNAGARDEAPCTINRDCGCEELGEIVIASRLGGEYPSDNGLEPKDYTEHAELYAEGNFGNRATDQNVVSGRNPNDEHAIILPIAGGQRVFAVRDDDPWQVSSGHPYVLVQYPLSGNPESPDLFDIDVYRVMAEQTGVCVTDGCDVGMDCCVGGADDGSTCSVDATARTSCSITTSSLPRTIPPCGSTFRRASRSTRCFPLTSRLPYAMTKTHRRYR